MTSSSDTPNVDAARTTLAYKKVVHILRKAHEFVHTKHIHFALVLGKAGGATPLQSTKEQIEVIEQHCKVVI